MPWLEEAPLSLRWGSYGSMEMEERECGWLERQRVSRNPWETLQYAREKCFESDPPPSFYSFFRGSRVLSPWFGL